MSAGPERWLPVVGYDGRYEVSDMGRVRSTRGLFGPRLLQGTRRGGRYRRVCLTKDGKQRTPNVHGLVLTAFVGPRPPSMQGCHYDGDFDNNRLTNLRWGTPSENTRDKLRHNRHDPRPGERSNFAKLTELQVKEIRALHATGGLSRTATAAKYGISKSHVGLIVRRKTWAHVAPEGVLR